MRMMSTSIYFPISRSRNNALIACNHSLVSRKRADVQIALRVRPVSNDKEDES